MNFPGKRNFLLGIGRKRSNNVSRRVWGLYLLSLQVITLPFQNTKLVLSDSVSFKKEAFIRRNKNSFFPAIHNHFIWVLANIEIQKTVINVLAFHFILYLMWKWLFFYLTHVEVSSNWSQEKLSGYLSLLFQSGFNQGDCFDGGTHRLYPFKVVAQLRFERESIHRGWLGQRINSLLKFLSKL